jgi:hypothetical protein
VVKQLKRVEFEYSENKKQRRIERKYNNLIEQALMDYKDKTMGELWDYLDNLKLSMKEELIKVGIISEDK